MINFITLPAVQDIKRHAKENIGAGFLLTASIVSALLNLFFLTIAARSLSSTSFAQLSIGLTVLGIAGLLFAGVQTEVIALSTRSRSLPNEKLEGKFVPPGTLLLLGLSVPVSLLIVVVLKLDRAYALVFLVSVLPLLLTATSSGILAAAKRIFYWQIVVISMAVIKIAWGASMSELGLESVFYLLSVPVGMGFAAFLYRLKILNLGVKFVNFRLSNSLGKGVLPVAIWVGLSLDLLVSRGLLGPDQVGDFAVSASLVKPLPVLIAGVGILYVSRLATDVINQEVSVRPLTKLLLGAAILSVVGVALLGIAGPLIVARFFGGTYENATYYILPMAIASIPWAVTFALANALMASDRSPKLVSLMLGLLPLQYVLLFLSKGNLTLYIAMNGVTGLFALISVMFIVKRSGLAPAG